jgi:ABC-2 type transport system permease protein
MQTSEIFQQEKKKLLSRFGIVIAIVLLINFVSFRWHKRIDLTNDNRFTISQGTKNLLANSKEKISIKVLLAGNLPSNYTKLMQGTSDLLKSLQDASNGKITYTFENPWREDLSKEEKQLLGKNLAEKGLFPIPITKQISGGSESQFIFPYATIFANGKEEHLNLLEPNYGNDESLDGALTSSESLLEYKFASAIKACYKADKANIAYVMGNGQNLGPYTYDALNTLGKLYKLDTIDATKGIEIPAAYQCIIICRPTIPFDEKTKFKLDQYVMNGGKILWFIDAINCNLDTMSKSPTYTAIPFELNLDDQLLKYGVRCNNNLIEDLQCVELPLTTGYIGDKPKIESFPWVYYPIHTAISKHLIVNNMDGVYSRFVGTIDTIENKDNVKNILLSSSQYSRALAAPLTVSFNMVRYKPNTALYNKSNMPIAVCIEGGFSSLFENRVDAGFLKVYEDSLGKKFAAHTKENNKMIVVSDADIILNDFNPKKGLAPLGYYTQTGKLYANKIFLLNCVEYLVDQSNLLDARSKDVQLRLLDKARVDKNKTVIQFLNIALPILLIILAGAVYFFFRKKKYEHVL